ARGGGRGRHPAGVGGRPRRVAAGARGGGRVPRRAGVSVEIRPAVPSDAQTLAELRWEFRVARAPSQENRDAFVARCAAWMRDELTSADRWRAWIAVDDGAIVGQAWLQIVEKMPNPVAERARHGYVSNVFVQPAFRGG